MEGAGWESVNAAAGCVILIQGQQSVYRQNRTAARLSKTDWCSRCSEGSLPGAMEAKENRSPVWDFGMLVLIFRRTVRVVKESRGSRGEDLVVFLQFDGVHHFGVPLDSQHCGALAKSVAGFRSDW